MKVLVVCHPPLGSEGGASQTALKLAAALRERGHDAAAWSPEPLPARARWWDRWLWQRRRLEEHLRGHRYDVLDLPAVSISRRIAASAPLVVARSVQPELLYLRITLHERRRALLPREPLRLAAERAAGWGFARALIAGWRRARIILCLGSGETRWMRERFPRLAPRLRTYVEAPSPGDQAALASVRKARRPAGRGGVRFLWIGRWVPHKGTRRLLRFLTDRAAACPGDAFTLAGCGPGALADCPPELVAAGRIRTVPSFRRGELPALLSGHDAGLFTSETEGWGLSLNEMLESGMPVHATEAGGVEDLRPFYPRDLRPFPPPAGPVVPSADDPTASGYFERFTWPRIAERYEAEVLRA
jgi:glycosyltransferase involved in cell wall biosynthesis